MMQAWSAWKAQQPVRPLHGSAPRPRPAGCAAPALGHPPPAGASASFGAPPAGQPRPSFPPGSIGTQQAGGFIRHAPPGVAWAPGGGGGVPAGSKDAAKGVAAGCRTIILTSEPWDDQQGTRQEMGQGGEGQGARRARERRPCQLLTHGSRRRWHPGTHRLVCL
jgi:hypothetical protein